MRALANALSLAGHRVVLICGGADGHGHNNGHDNDGHVTPHKIVQLPPLKAAIGDFGTLLTADGQAADDAYFANRCAQLLRQVREDSPQVLIVETFPFGRRAMRFELVALMEMCAAFASPPLRICSLRDILQTRTAKRYRQTCDEVAAWFDGVVVHGDKAVVELAETFPLADELADKVFYSGYLHHINDSPPQHINDSPRNKSAGGVVVSAGGGAVGIELLQTAIAARAFSKLRNRQWRILVGGNVEADAFAALRAHAHENAHKNGGDGGIVVERNRDDFAKLLANCAVSVSQAGYNTVLDVVAAGCAAVLVPFAKGGETEQTLRAAKFVECGYAVAVAETALTPRTLAAAIDRAAELDLAKCRAVDRDGARKSVEIIERLAGHVHVHKAGAQVA